MHASSLLALTALMLSRVSRAGYSEDYISIQNTLAIYPLAIDSKDFALLDQVFTDDVVADYSAPLNVLSGLTQVETVLQQSLAPVTTQHGYTTQRIDIHANDTADSTTYYVANHFGRGAFAGQVLYAYGKYVDRLVRVHHRPTKGMPASSFSSSSSALPQWRVQNRTLVYMGPFIGNLSVFGE